jgi:death-on-curing protein
MDIKFLSVAGVLAIHDETMETDGGLAGVRDPGLLESAVMMPQAQFGGRYLHESVEAMAAAYLFHIAQAHAFHDGNKRTAVMAALVFLDNNGDDVAAKSGDIERLGLAVASGEMGKSDVTDWMRRFTRRRGAPGRGRSEP